MVSQLGITACKLVLISTLLSLCCNAQEPDIRLFGGSGNYEGRVEVRVNGRWGTVCNETWDIQDATVVCRELGNRTAIKYDMMYGEGEGPILYTNSMCTGEEERLQDCPKEEPTADVCKHTQDAGVQCGFKDVDLRLVGGSTPNEGRVEVYKKGIDGMGEWGRVCAGSDWDRREANVVCRTVGYPNGAEASSGSFGSGNGWVFIIDVTCTGTETTFLDCKETNTGKLQACPKDEVDATVVCIPTSLVATEELSTGAIAGIGVGFGLVIIICCIFSLNCKCRPCWKKREVDDTDVYAAASKVLSTTSNLKSESDNRQDSISDIDPNMFIFAPKNPPAGFGMSSDASGTNSVLPNINETKEPNGVLTGSNKKDGSSSQDNHATEDEQKTSTEGDHVAVSMTTEENMDDNHVYDDVKLTLGEGIDMHDEKGSERVTIDVQGGAHFNKESHYLDDHDYGEIVDNKNAELDDHDYGEIVDNKNAELVDNDNPELEENKYIEIVANYNPELREDDYLEPIGNENPELRHNYDSIQNEDVAEDENKSVLMDQQAGAHFQMGMTDEDIDPSDLFIRMELENFKLL